METLTTRETFSLEKPQVEITAHDVEEEDESRRRNELKVIRLVDMRLTLLLGLLYSFANIDRINLGLARVAGLGEALHLGEGHRYSIVSFVFSIGSILVQIPTGALLRRVGAPSLLAFCAVSWGIVQLCMAFVSTWGYLLLCRILLGVLEGPFLPSFVFITTTWYTRYELQKRIAGFAVISLLASGFSPILAYSLSLLDGRGGLAGWSWIFLVEGLITIALGLLSWFFIPDVPERNNFLTEEQTLLVLKRVAEDRGDSFADEVTLLSVLHHLNDWVIWVHGMMFFCSTVPQTAISFFMTIILNGMGWSKEKALLLSAPPYVLALFSSMLFAWWSDKCRLRAPFIAAQVFITIAGLVTTAYSPSHSWRYAGIFLIASGTAGCSSGILAYSSNNVILHSKRAASVALMVGFGGVGSIFATTTFREQDFPRYVPGLWASVGCQLLLLALLLLTSVHYYRINKIVRSGGPPVEGQQGFRHTI
ncbi:MFS transporter superfamily protein [Pleurotus pulmonarius]